MTRIASSLTDSFDFQWPLISLPREKEIPEKKEWHSDATALYSLSLLRKKSKKQTSEPLLNEVLDYLLGQGVFLEVAPSLEELSFFQALFSWNAADFKEGLIFESQVKDLLNKGDDPNGPILFANLCRQLEQRVRSLRLNERMVLYNTSLSSGQISENKFVKDCLKGFFPETWINRLSLYEGESIDTLAAKISKEIIEALKTQGIFSEEEIEQTRGILTSGIDGMSQGLSWKTLPKKFGKTVIESLKNHIKKKLLQQCPPQHRQRFRLFLEKAFKIGLKEALSLEIKQVIDSTSKKALQQVRFIQKSLKDQIPQDGHLILQSFGITLEDSLVWIEIEKEESGNYTLHVHGAGNALKYHSRELIEGVEHIRVTERFVNIPGEKFDAAFFHHFLSLRVWPSWSQDYKASISDFYERQLKRLGPISKEMQPQFFIPVETSRPICSSVDLLHHLSSRATGIKHEDMVADFVYPLLKNALCSDFESYQMDLQNKEKAQEIQRAKNILLDLSRRLYREKKIEESELKTIYATAFEIDQEIKKHDLSNSFMPIDMDEAGRDFLGKIIQTLRGSSSHAEAVKRGLIAAFGEGVKKSIDEAFEGIEAYSDSKKLDQQTIPRTWSETAKEFVSYMRQLRRDIPTWDVWDFLIFIYKIFCKMRQLLQTKGDSIALYYVARHTNQCLKQIIPGYCKLDIFSSRLSQILLMIFGPSFIKKVASKRLVKTYYTILGRLHSWREKAENGAIYHAVRLLAPRFLSQEKVMQKSDEIKKGVQYLLREGSIGYHLHLTFWPIQKVSLKQSAFAISPAFSSLSKQDALKKESEKTFVLGSTFHQIDRRLGLSPEIQCLEKLRYIRQLPVPSRLVQTKWDKNGNISSLLTAIEEISKEAYFLEEIRKISFNTSGMSLRAEVCFAYLKLYTIVDHLARQCPDVCLDGVSTLPPELLLMLENRTYPLDYDLQKQLIAICEYYHIDPRDEYTEKAIDLASLQCVTQWSSFLRDRDERAIKDVILCSHLPVIGNSSAALKYLKSLLNNPKVIQRLDSLGHDEGRDVVDSVLLLIEDKPLDSIAEAKASSTYYHLEKRKALLPSAYFYLLMVYNKLVTGFLKESRACDDSYHCPSLEQTYALPLFEKQKRTEKSFFFGSRHITYFKSAVLNDRFFEAFTTYIDTVQENSVLNYGGINNTLPLLQTSKSENLIRIISYLHINPNKLMDHNWTSLLGNLLFQCGTTLDWLSRSSHAKAHLDSFFKHMRAYWLRESQMSCDFFHEFRREEIQHELITHAIFLEQMVESAKNNTESSFIEIRHYILQELWSHYSSLRDKEWSGGFYYFLWATENLVLLHSEETFIELDEQKQEVFIQDFVLYGCMLTAYLDNDSQIKKREMNSEIKKQRFWPVKATGALLYRQHIEILWEYLDQNKDRRNKILTEVAIKMGKCSNQIDVLSWSGSFPYYCSSSIEIKLLSVAKPADAAEDFKTRSIKETLEKILLKPIESILSIGLDAYFIPELLIEVHVNNGHYSISYKGKNGVLHLISREGMDPSPPKDLFSKDVLIWVDSKDDMSVVKNLYVGSPWDKEMKRFKINLISSNGKHDFSVDWRACDSHGKLTDPIDLSGVTHQLGLFSWFTSLDAVEVCSSIDDPRRIASLKLREYDLEFEVQGEKHLKAYNKGVFLNFAIAERQKCDELKSFSRYLLLENDQKQRKVLLSCVPSMQLLAAYFFPLGSNSFFSLHFRQLFERKFDGFDSTKRSYYSYNIQAGGDLESEDSAACAYLLVYYISLSEYNRASVVLHKLALQARLAPFTEEVIAILSPLYGLAFVNTSPNFSKLILRIAFIQEENRLLPQSKSEKSEKILEELLSWVAVQKLYVEYIERWEVSDRDLSEYEELIILNSIANRACQFIKEKMLNASEDMRGISQILGLDNIVESVLMPKVLLKRFKSLRRRHSIPGEDALSKLEITLRLYGAYNNNPSLVTPSIDSGLGVHCGKDGRFTRELKEVVAMFAQRLFNPSWIEKTSQVFLDELKFEKWIESINLLEAVSPSMCRFSYKPGMFSTYFMAYYSIVAEDPCKKSDDEAAVLRKNQLLMRQLFSELSLCSGGRESIFFKILKVILDSENKNQWPKGAQLRAAFLKFRDEKNDTYLRTYFLNIFQLCSKLTVRESFWQSSHFYGIGKVVVKMGIERLKSKAISLTLQTAQHLALSQISKEAATALALYRSSRTVYDVAKAIQGIYSEMSEGRLLETSSSPGKDEKIAEDIACQMKKIDAKFDTALEKIHAEIFSIHQLQRELPATLYLHEGNAISAAERHHIRKINQSCLDFDARNPKLPPAFELTGKKGISHLKQQLTLLLQKVSVTLESEKEEIERFIRDIQKKEELRPLSVSEAVTELRYPLCKVIRLKPVLTLKTIAHFFLKAEPAMWQSVALLNEEQIAALERKLYYYFVKATRRDQCARVLDHIVKIEQARALSLAQVEALLDEFHAEIRQRRSYDVSDLPARLVRAHLVFEWINNKMLWVSQAKQVDSILSSDKERRCLELIMGSGKTFFGIPTINFMAADGKRLMINIWPSPAAKVSTKQTSDQLYRSFGLSSHALDINRNTQLDRNILWGLLRRIRNGFSQGEVIHMSKEQMQAFELRFLLAGYEMLNTSLSLRKRIVKREELFYLGRILYEIRWHATANIDEAHEVFSRKKELNYPRGATEHPDRRWIGAIHQIFIYALNNDSIKSVLHIQDNQKPISTNTYKELLLPHLARDLARWSFLEVADAHLETLENYFSGQAKSIPDFVVTHPKRLEIDLIKGILSSVLPRALKLNPREHYGPSRMKGGSEFAIPYEACDKPLEQATIRNPHEAIVKTFLAFLYNRLNTDQVAALCRKMLHKAKLEKIKKKISIERTIWGRLFSKWTHGEKLIDWEKISLPTLTIHLSNHHEAVLLYASSVAERIRYFTNNLKSDSQNAASMVHSFYSDTGSPYNHYTYPIETEVLFDKGTQGETKYLMQIKQSLHSVCIVESVSNQAILKEILDHFFSAGSHMFAIIDRGAFFRGMSNYEVAFHILAHIEVHRKDLLGVVFYNDDNEQVILQRGSHTPCNLNEVSLAKDKRMTFFDQAHTYASDIPQPECGKAVLTVSEDTTHENFAQAVWRMRGLRKKQSITILIKKESKHYFSQSDVPSLEDIYAHIVKNEGEGLGEDHYYADRQKIHDIVRRAALDKLLSVFEEMELSEVEGRYLTGHSLQSAIEEILSRFKEFKSIFIEEEDFDPIALYGAVDVMADPVCLIEQYKRSQFAFIESCERFTDEEKANVRKRLSLIGGGCYLEQVHTYTRNGELDVKFSDTLDQQMEAEAEEETSRESDLSVEMENESQRVSCNEQIVRPYYKWHNTAFWNLEFNCFDLDWLQFEDLSHSEWNAIVALSKSAYSGQQTTQTVLSLLNPLSKITRVDVDRVSRTHVVSNPCGMPLYRLGDFLSLAQEECIRSISSQFDPLIFFSHNFAPSKLQGISERVIDPLTPNRKKASEVLVIEQKNIQGKSSFHIGLIDHNDVSFWREKLRSKESFKSVRIGLYNLGLSGLVGSSDPLWNLFDLHSHTNFLRSLVQVKFYNGEFVYNEREQEVLMEWILRSGAKRMHIAFQAIIASTDSTSSYDCSDIEFVFDQLLMTKGPPRL